MICEYLWHVTSDYGISTILSLEMEELECVCVYIFNYSWPASLI